MRKNQTNEIMLMNWYFNLFLWLKKLRNIWRLMLAISNINNRYFLIYFQKIIFIHRCSLNEEMKSLRGFVKDIKPGKNECRSFKKTYIQGRCVMSRLFITEQRIRKYM